jgi:hypothetical protein
MLQLAFGVHGPILDKNVAVKVESDRISDSRSDV